MGVFHFYEINFRYDSDMFYNVFHQHLALGSVWQNGILIALHRNQWCKRPNHHLKIGGKTRNWCSLGRPGDAIWHLYIRYRLEYSTNIPGFIHWLMEYLWNGCWCKLRHLVRLLYYYLFWYIFYTNIGFRVDWLYTKQPHWLYSSAHMSEYPFKFIAT